MLVYIDVPAFKGKTFTLVCHTEDNIARLLALCYHVLYDSGVTLGPFVLKSSGEPVPLNALVESYAHGTDSFYKEAAFELEEVSASNQNARSEANGLLPFITSPAVNDALIEETTLLKSRQRNFSILFVLLQFSWLFAFVASVFITWWQGIPNALVAFYFLWTFPNKERDTSMVLTVSPESVAWLKGLSLWSAAIIVYTLFKVAWFHLDGAVFPVLFSLAFICLDYAFILVYSASQRTALALKIGSSIEQELLQHAALNVHHTQGRVNIDSLDTMLEFIRACPNNVAIFIERTLHIDAINYMPHPVATKIVHYLSSIRPAQMAMVESSSLENISHTLRIARAANDEYALMYEKHLFDEENYAKNSAKKAAKRARKFRTKLSDTDLAAMFQEHLSTVLLILARLFPLSRIHHDQLACSEDMVAFLTTLKMPLPLGDRVHAIQILHAIVENPDLRETLEENLLDGFITLLDECKGDSADHVLLMLADLASTLRARDYYDSATTIRVLYAAAPFLHHENMQIVTLALAVFHAVIKMDESLALLQKIEHEDLWPHLADVLDTTYSALHTSSCTCARLVIAIAELVHESILSIHAHAAIQHSLVSALEKAKYFNLPRRDRQQLLDFLQAFAFFDYAAGPPKAHPLLPQQMQMQVEAQAQPAPLSPDAHEIDRQEHAMTFNGETPRSSSSPETVL